MLKQRYPIQMVQPKESYTIDYPSAIAAARQQNNIIWYGEELGVGEDVDDLRSRCTVGERHGVIYGMRIFTKYELMFGGDELWGGKIQQMFQRPDIQRMANSFSFAEINMHAPFYNEINKALHIDTDEFYNSWKEDPVLVERVKFVQDAGSKSDLHFLASLAFMEGCSLFVIFAFLKSFNSNGFKMIPHICAGIDASAKDENFHSMGSAWLFNQYILEAKALEEDGLTGEALASLQADIYEIAKNVFAHESQIIEQIFQHEGIRTVKKEDIIQFAKDRINVVLAYLQMKPMFPGESGVISSWFYNQLSTYKYADIFHTQQTQYVRNYDETKLAFNPNVQLEF